jgi:hypothetical protein
MNKHNLLNLNYDQIVNDQTLCLIVRLTALNLRINPYLTLGDFFQRLTTRQLHELYDFVLLAEGGDEVANDNLLVLCQLLARAEGIFASSTEEISTNLKLFCVIIRSVVLHNKGKVTVKLENLTFGAEYYDIKPFIQRNI